MSQNRMNEPNTRNNTATVLSMHLDELPCDWILSSSNRKLRPSARTQTSSGVAVPFPWFWYTPKPTYLLTSMQRTLLSSLNFLSVDGGRAKLSVRRQKSKFVSFVLAYFMLQQVVKEFRRKAASHVVPLLITERFFCCVHRNGDSQYFSKDWTIPKNCPSRGGISTAI